MVIHSERERHLEFPPLAMRQIHPLGPVGQLVCVRRSGRITQSERLILASSGKTKNANSECSELSSTGDLSF
jgi:hypothetical protein